MGLTPGSVKAALKGKLERMGRFCMEVSEALELVFDYEENRRSNAIVADSGPRDGGATPMEEAPALEVSPVQKTVLSRSPEHKSSTLIFSPKMSGFPNQ